VGSILFCGGGPTVAGLLVFEFAVDNTCLSSPTNTALGDSGGLSSPLFDAKDNVGEAKT
jgi:hypothetical protein